MPAKERLRRDHERRPSIPRKSTACRGEKRPVPVIQIGAADRPPEDLHLVTKDGVLELELGEPPASGERSHEPDEHEVEEGSQGAGMLPACVDHARNPGFGAPQGSSSTTMACGPRSQRSTIRGWRSRRPGTPQLPTSIAYQVTGSGPPDIVFVNSAYVSNVELVWEWPFLASFLRGLAARGRLVLFDRRGRDFPTACGERLPTLEARMDDIRGHCCIGRPGFRRGDWCDEIAPIPTPLPGPGFGVRWLPVPARSDHPGGSVVPALRPLLPRRRRAPRRTRHRGRPGSIFRWVQRFAPEFIETARARQHVVGDCWHVEETYVKVGGTWRYLFRAVDQFGQVIDVFLSSPRNREAARRFLQARHGPDPDLTRGGHHRSVPGLPSRPG